jgi:ZIP family zinc transporter
MECKPGFRYGQDHDKHYGRLQRQEIRVETNVLVAFALTAFAGLSTGIGSAIAFFADHTNRSFLAASLGFSAGVMIYVSFVELFPLSHEFLAVGYGESTGAWITTAAFFGGMLLTALVDYLVPSYENPHEAGLVEEIGEKREHRQLERVGLMTALAIGIHNFPEGLATFFAALSSLSAGIPVAIAIALHNIPEGISVSVPMYFATGSRKKAFTYSFLSGVSEPVGALAGYLVLRPFISDPVMGVVFGEGHPSVYGLIAGMAVMAISLLLL